MQILAVAIVGVTVGSLIATGIGAPNSTLAVRPMRFFKRIAASLRPHAGGLGIAVAALAAFTFWTQSWSFWSARSTERKAYANLTKDAAAYHDASLGNANMPFLMFVRGELGTGKTFALAPESSRDDAFTRQWSTYVLLPNLLTEEQDADILVLFNADPDNVEYDRALFPEVEVFAPGYAIARRSE